MTIEPRQAARPAAIGRADGVEWWHRRATAGLAVAIILAATLGTACDSSLSPGPTGSGSALASPAASGLAGTAETSTPPDSPSASGSPGHSGVASATDLILAAQDAGRLDGPTALLYRVYAVFGDPRLPAEFARGEWSDDEAALGAAVEQLDTLPDDIAAELRPFVVRPTEPESVFFGASEAAAGSRVGPELAALYAAPGLGIATVTCTSTRWGYADGTAAFRVWGRCGGSETERAEREKQIQLAVSWLDEIWLAVKTYMDREPILDGGTVDQGADPDLGSADAGGARIDIYLTSQCVTRGGDCHGFSDYAAAYPSPQERGRSGSRKTSGFIVMNRAMTSNPLFARVALAHEFFHVVQNAFNREGVRADGRSYWFVEASATWAQWRFVPGASALAHHTMTPARFAGFQESTYSLQEADQGSNRYFSWAWPLFMDEESAGAVARAWQGIEGKTTYEQVNAAIDGAVRFATRFRDFAVRAHNRELSPTQDPDLRKLFPDQAVGTPRVPPGTGRLDDEVQLHAGIPGIVAHTKSEFISSLYAVYRPFKVDDDVGKVVFDFSGLSPQATFDVDAIVKIKDRGWERRKLTNGQTTFCRDNAKDRVEEIVIVLSNHDLDRTARVVGTWTVESLAVGCAPLTGVLTIKRTASFLQLDPAAPDERRDEDLTATIVVNMRPDPWAGGYTDAYDPADPASVSSSYTVARSFGASRRFGDCTASFSTRSRGTWQFKDHPTAPEDENGITGFVDRAAGVAGFSIVIHYPYEVVEDICNLYTEPNVGVHDAFVCLDTTYIEVDGGPDRIDVHCSSDVPAMGYSLTTETIDGTLYLADE